MSPGFVAAGAINGFFAVALGALGKHWLKEYLDDHALAVFQTGAYYHMSHALALVLVGLLVHVWGRSLLLRWSGWLLLVGMVLFSGSLYLLAVTDVRALGIVTPVGGLCLLGGWFCLAWIAIKKTRSF